MSVIVAAGEAGATFEELATATGLKTATLRQGCHFLESIGVQKARTAKHVLRLFAPGVAIPEKPAPTPRPPRPPRVAKPKKPRVQKVLVKKPAKQSVVWNSTGLKAPKKPAPQIVAEVDYSRAKVTHCPSFQDQRHTVRQPEPFFSAMTPGSYLPTDSWAARVYGGMR